MLTYALILLVVSMLCFLLYSGWYKQSSQRLGLKSANAMAADEPPNEVSAEKVLVLMNEIDMAILSNATFTLLIESIFPKLISIFPSSMVAITQLRTSATETTNTTMFNSAKDTAHCLIALDKSLRYQLNHHPEGFLLESVDTHASLKPLADFGANAILILPIYIEADVSAVFYIGFSDKKQCSTYTQQILGSFSARLGVALTFMAQAKRLFDKKHFDLVTSLPNRSHFIELLALEVSRANRYKSKIAVLCIGLEGIKKINEIAGYAVGDEVLRQVAERLRSSLRTTDVIGRFNSDEFVVILPEIVNDVGVGKVVGKLIQKISELYTQGVNQFYLNCRIGISTYPSDGQTVDTLLSKASYAMAMTKVSEFTFHTEKINTAITKQLLLESDLRSALEGDELFVLYQPQIDLRTEKIVGVEALVRWQHPEKGVVPPLDFLAIAEETELIHHVGAYVRQATFKHYSAWKALGIAPNKVAFNISSKELMHPNFVHDFETLLQTAEIDPSSVEIEITESLLLDITDNVNEGLERLRGLGVSVAIDDFGTGYSSLSYITQLPFDVLKLDRSFVAEIGKSVDKVEIVSLIIDMAHHLKKSICAEGVENKEQLEFLQSRGCETAQGYLLSRPISAKDYESFVLNWNAEINQKVHQLDEVKG